MSFNHLAAKTAGEVLARAEILDVLNKGGIVPLLKGMFGKGGRGWRLAKK